MSELERVLHKVSRPGRYTGGEWNSVRKEWDQVDVRVVLAYPDAYEIGMSNLGVMILYDILNRRPNVLAERVYAPWVDMAAEIKRTELPLFSIESRRPVKDFDVIGFSLGYELAYTNALGMLDLSGIPLVSAERGDGDPLVIAGGSCAMNPEPMADFIDAFVVGDGEEVMVELVELYRRWKGDGSGVRSELLAGLAGIEGVYVPGLYRPEYEEDGRFRLLAGDSSDASLPITRRIVSQLLPPVASPVVPLVEITHDRGAVEIQRGCTRGCRFCQASIIYRPIRERSVAEVVKAVEDLESNCGYEEVSLLSLSTSDYSGIVDLVGTLSDTYRGSHLNFSLPSLRPDALSVGVARAMQTERKMSLTFAPEAGTDRLRRCINKGISEEDLLWTVEVGLKEGWRSFKLYFMIGLPTETDEDVQGIVDLVRRVRQVRGANGTRPNIRANVSTFIPKPHTPLQWVAQNCGEDLDRKHDILRRGLKKAETKLSWHDPKVSLLEGVMSRGDRRLGNVIRRAWELGCTFDAWSDMFRFDLWMQAFEECGIDPMSYVGERGLDSPFPWGHIDTGVSAAFLKREYHRALACEPTPDCRTGVCNGCGMERLSEACRGRVST